MYYGNIKKYDIADGEGVRVTLFVSGCTHHCKGCFQPETWDFTFGREFTKETEKELLEALEDDYIAGLTLLGGEPFEPENQRVLLPFLRKVKERFPRKTIWSYSGYLYEELKGEQEPPKGKSPHCEVTDEMLSLIDVLVDGKFVEEKRDLMLQFRGSSNQRLIDVKETGRRGAIIPYELKNGGGES